MIDKIEEFCLNILTKIGLKKLADWYKQHQEGMRYLVFGVLTTIINIITAAVTYYFIFANFSEEWKVNLSTIVAIIVAWIFAYVTNKLYVFNTRTSHWKELLKEMVSFISCRIVTAIVEIALMNILVTVLMFHYMVMKIVVSVIVIVLNYIFSKLFIFKKGNNNHEENA